MLNTDVPHSIPLLDGVQARRTTAFVLVNGVYGDVTFDTTDVETDAAVLDHDLATNSDNIIIGPAGLYALYYRLSGDQQGTTAVGARVRVNDTTVIPGSTVETPGVTHNNTHDYELTNTVLVELAAGDFITMQAERIGASASTTTVPDLIFSAVLLKRT